MARRIYRKIRHRKPSFTVPIAAVGGAVAGLFLAPEGGSRSPIDIAKDGNYTWAMHELIYNYTGYHGQSGKWMPQNAKGLMAAVAGFAVHWMAGKIGINRTLGRAKIPILRI